MRAYFWQWLVLSLADVVIFCLKSLEFKKPLQELQNSAEFQRCYMIVLIEVTWLFW